MNKLNLPPFYVGQKVVYITGINMRKDSVHTVKGITRFECGCYGIDIGVVVNTFSIGRCGLCKKRFADPIEFFWWQAESFRPLQQQSFPLIKLSQIKETEKEEILITN